jgi:hypothetical protein
MRHLLVTILATLLAACGAPTLNDVPLATVSVKDLRPLEERKSNVSVGAYSTEVVLADDVLRPPPLELFARELNRSLLDDPRNPVHLLSFRVHIKVPRSKDPFAIHDAVNLADAKPDLSKVLNAINVESSTTQSKTLLVASEVRVAFGGKELTGLARESYKGGLSADDVSIVATQALRDLLQEARAR